MVSERVLKNLRTNPMNSQGTDSFDLEVDILVVLLV